MYFYSLYGISEIIEKSGFIFRVFRGFFIWKSIVETTYAEVNQMRLSTGLAILAVASEIGPRILFLLESQAGEILILF
ncbi:MAG: hypothetical protein HY774_26660 [Acidobacteria bacterium]|nr:hypothetical protein [Acidobacteriota bacterium]